MLLTSGDSADNQNRLIALRTEDELQWLKPELPWEQVEQMAVHVAVDESQLEHVLTSLRMLRARHL